MSNYNNIYYFLYHILFLDDVKTFVNVVSGTFYTAQLQHALPKSSKQKVTQKVK